MPSIKPTLIAIGGLSASGKTTLSDALVDVFNGFATDITLATISSDVTLKTLWAAQNNQAVDLYTKLPAEAYEAEFGKKVYGAMIKAVQDNLQTNDIVIMDATFSPPHMREEFEKTAKDAGGKFVGIWLDAPSKSLINRADKRAASAKSISDADGSIVEKQLQNEIGDIDWVRIDASQSKRIVTNKAVSAIIPVFN